MPFHEDCPECEGRRIVPSQYHVKLYDVCPTCRGAGGRDWIEKARNRYSENEFQKTRMEILKENVHSLLHEAQNQAAEAGYYIEYSFKPVNRADRYENYVHKLYKSKWEEL